MSSRQRRDTLRPMTSAAVAFLRSAEPGTRVVVRYRFEDGLTDALGYLRHRDDGGCTVDTRRGEVTIAYDAVTLAKSVPEPPARRPR